MGLAARLLLLAQNGNPSQPSVSTHIDFSLSALQSNVPAGQVVGALTTTGGTAPFVYTISNGKFVIVGSNVLRGIVGTLTPGTPEIFNFTVTDANSNVYDTAASGAQGPFSIPVNAPSALDVALKVTNLNSGAVANTPHITFCQSFKDADIPAGSAPQLVDSSGNIVTAYQIDRVARWPSGAMKFCQMSLAAAENWAASQQRTYRLQARPSVPSSTPAAGWGATVADWKATLMGACDIQVIYTGQDCGANTYKVILNDVLTNYSQRVPPAGWGTSYPTGGWEITKQGPVALEFHGWQYIKNYASGFFHGYVRCDIWVKAWSPTGPFEVDVRTCQPNIWNTIDATSEKHNTSQGRFAAYVQVKDGATTLKYDGGTSDVLGTVIANADFNTTTKRITASASPFPQTAVIFTAGTSLPTGLVAGQMYWLAAPQGGANPYVVTAQQYCALIEQNGTTPSWQPSTSYNVGAWVMNNNIQYICATAGTSASSGGPTGGGVGSNITDGTVHWTNVTIGFTSQGVGTLTAYPVSCCFPSTGWLTASNTGDSIWSGAGTRPQMTVGCDFDYQMSTGFTLPYNSAAGATITNLPVFNYLPNRQCAGMQWAQSATGGSNARIGPLNNNQVAALYLPEDPYYYQLTLAGASCWHNALYMFMYDESGGMPLCTAPSNITGLPSSLSAWTQNNVPGQVSGSIVARSAAWSPWNYTQQNVNGLGGQYYADPSHVPNNSQIAYYRTGRECFLDLAINQANVYCTMVYLGYQTLNGTTYSNLINGDWNSTQLRGWAWALRCLFNAMFMIPDDHLYYGALKSAYEQNILYEVARITSVYPAAQLACGIPDCLDHDNGGAHYAPWMLGFYHLVSALEAKRRGQTSAVASAVLTNVNFLKLYWNNYLPSVNANAVNYYGTYDLLYASSSRNWAACYPPGVATLSAAATIGFIPPLWISYLYDHDTGAWVTGFAGNTLSYQAIGQAAVTMMALALPGDSNLQLARDTISARLSSASGISQATGGIQWTGSSGGVILNEQNFAVFHG
jgi:hypothetical protein